MATKPLPTVEEHVQQIAIVFCVPYDDRDEWEAAKLVRQRDAAIRAEGWAAGAAAERERCASAMKDGHLLRALPPLPPEGE